MVGLSVRLLLREARRWAWLSPHWARSLTAAPPAELGPAWDRLASVAGRPWVSGQGRPLRRPGKQLAPVSSLTLQATFFGQPPGKCLRRRKWGDGTEHSRISGWLFYISRPVQSNHPISRRSGASLVAGLHRARAARKEVRQCASCGRWIPGVASGPTVSSAMLFRGNPEALQRERQVQAWHSLL